MTSLHRLATRALALFLFTVASPAHAWWDDSGCKHSAERSVSIDTTGAQRVEIIARAGDLAVHPAAGTTLTGKGKACASKQEYLAQTQLHVKREGSVIRVWVDLPESFSGIGLFYASLDLAVNVPANLPVAITDSSGDMTLDGVRVTRIDDSSGDVVATHLTGDVEVSDSSGDVRIEDCAGRVQVADSSGDIVVRRAAAVHVRNDSSGDIVIEHVAGDVKIDGDSSGDITVRDVGKNLTLLADTSGNVNVSDVRGVVSLPKD